MRIEEIVAFIEKFVENLLEKMQGNFCSY